MCGGSGLGAATPLRHLLNLTSFLMQHNNPAPRIPQSLSLSQGRVNSGIWVSFPGHTSFSLAETKRDLLTVTGFWVDSGFTGLFVVVLADCVPIQLI